ncbi:hypothetical protein D9M69_639590 [compost metagenome]
MIGRHHFLYLSDHEINDLLFREAQHIAQLGHNNVFDLCFSDNFFEIKGKIGYNNNGFRF